jgi:Zn-finger nucleic acid-binding protein
MICPACRSDMIVVEHKKIELDYCPKCHGVWFDSGELELFLESIKLENPGRFVGNAFNAPEAETTEKRRRCPICGRRMKKTAVGDRPRVLIDVCPKEHGLWFDGGEVDQLIKGIETPSGKASSHQQVHTFLGEVFKARE